MITVDISSVGRIHTVPAVLVGGQKIFLSGRGIRVGKIHDEPWLWEAPADFCGLVDGLKASGLGADIFTFSQRPPDVQPRFPYWHMMDNIAVVPITSYSDWWEALPQETRKNVRRAGKRGVTVELVPFDDRLVRGIKQLYDESPIRQGRRFWHYGKDLEAVRRENSTYTERADFLAAYLGEELVGFLKVVYLSNAGRIMQILSKNSHYDKRPMNALIAKAVEVCARRGVRYFIYGQYVYGNNTDASMVEFKRRNGFVPVEFPKYYAPLSARGRLAVGLNLHLGWRRLIPQKFYQTFLGLRSRFHGQHLRKLSLREASSADS